MASPMPTIGLKSTFERGGGYNSQMRIQNRALLAGNGAFYQESAYNMRKVIKGN